MIKLPSGLVLGSIWDPGARWHLGGCFQKTWEKREESAQPHVGEDEVGLLRALLCLVGRQRQSRAGEGQLRGAGLKAGAVWGAQAQEGRAAFVSCGPAAVPAAFIEIKLMDRRGGPESTPVPISAALPALKQGSSHPYFGKS